MKKLACEMCGSTNIVKEEGLFVCQTCGVKYSLDEARKMMAGETVEVEGTVKIDQSGELKNLYEVARRAKETNNASNALKYYDQILVKDPNSWEAQFYVVYYKSLSSKVEEITSASLSLINCFDVVLELVKNNVEESNYEKVLSEICDKILSISNTFFNSLKPFINIGMKRYVVSLTYCYDMNYILGNVIEEKFEGDVVLIAAEAWKQGINIHKRYYNYVQSNISRKKQQEKILRNYTNKIRKYDETYISPLEKRDINRLSIRRLFNKCPVCGEPLEENSDFCTECGSRIRK